MQESHRARSQVPGLRQSESDETREHRTILQSNITTAPMWTYSALEGTNFDAEAEENETAITDDLAASNTRSLTNLLTLAEQCRPLELFKLEALADNMQTLTYYLQHRRLF
jgi:hypothetical protein